MRRYSMVMLLSLAAAVPAQGQGKGTQQANATTQSFIDVEKKWNAALVKKDVSALDAILADGYVSTDEDGHLREKAAILARTKSHERNFQTMTLSDIRVHVYGDAAVVTGVTAASGTTAGKPMPEKFAFTDTFIRQNGVWRAVATHVSAVR